jgi:hypothetical protein
VGRKSDPYYRGWDRQHLREILSRCRPTNRTRIPVDLWPGFQEVGAKGKPGRATHEVTGRVTEFYSDDREAGNQVVSLARNAKNLAMQTWAPIISSIIVVTSGLMMWWLGRTSESHRSRTQLAAAFAGEILAISDILKIRKQAQVLSNAVNEKNWGRSLVVIPVDSPENYFKIYDANADKVGLLPSRLALDIVRYYTRIRASIEELRALEKGSYRTWPENEIMDSLTRILNFLGDTQFPGPALVDRLTKASRRGRFRHILNPEWNSVLTTEELNHLYKG